MSCSTDTTLAIHAASRWQLDVVLASEDEPPVPRDLTGQIARLRVRQGSPAGAIVLTATSADTPSGIISLPTPLEGLVSIDIPAAALASLVPGRPAHLEVDIHGAADDPPNPETVLSLALTVLPKSL
jgi:hypothetical protein